MNVAVVIPCFNLGRTLEEALTSARTQTHAPAEIVVVDDGSDDVFTRQILARLRRSSTRVLSTPNRGPAAARNLGIRSTTSPLVVLLDADDVLDASYLEKASVVLAARPDLGFVSCSLRAFGDASYVWTPPAATFVDTLVRGGMHISTMFRRDVFVAVGGFDEGLPAYEDTDFWLSAIERGFAGEILEEPLVHYRVRPRSRYHRALRPATYHRAKRGILEKHARHVFAAADEILPALDEFTTQLRAHARQLDESTEAAERELSSLKDGIAEARQALGAAGIEALDWGALRRLEPMAAVGERSGRRGVEARYVETFLGTNAPAPGARILHIGAPAAPEGDGSRPEELDQAPSESLDCVVMRDVLRYAPDPAELVRSAHRALRAGGTLLASLPCAASITDAPEHGRVDRWRFTEASARKLFTGIFPLESVEVTTFGNLLACVGALHGLEALELTTDELELVDPWFPLVVCVRAVKSDPEAAGPAVHDTETDAGAAVLLYHRIASLVPDTHGLCTPADEFHRQMELLREEYVPLDLCELAELARIGRIPRGAVAVTFDDGYLDNLTVASDILTGLGIPATFFVNTEDVTVEHEPWWDTLERILLSDLPLPPVLKITGRASVRSIPTAGPGERDAAIMTLHGVLLHAGLDERERIVEEVVRWSGTTLPARMSHRLMTDIEILKLARRPKQTIGAHTTHNLLLSAHPLEVQREEVTRNRVDLERILGHRVATFSYPYGDLTAETVQVVRDASFEVAVTVEPALVRAGTDPLLTPRLEVKPGAFPSFVERMARLLHGNRLPALSGT